MALITDPDLLSQGATTSPTDAAWGSPTGMIVTITSAGAGLPALAAGQYFAVRDHSQAVNNGLYKESGGSPSASSVTATKVSGSAPVSSAAEAISTLGTSANRPNIFYDTAAREVYLLEQNGLGFEGVTGQCVYSRMMIDWKDDAFLVKSAPFPMLCIDADAGKYFVGQDASGNNNGWNWKDTTSPATIRTRKLLRNMGWSEVDSNGIEKAIYPGIVTLGSFEDSTPGTGDRAYFQFGSDTTVDDTVNFDFTGPVNEAVKAYEEIGNPATCTFATSSTITRASGSFIADGYKVGGRVTIRLAGDASRNGSFVLAAVSALQLTVTGTPFVTGADATAILAVDNLNALTLRLRVRDADTNGKTFSQANLASAGETVLGNRVFKFPLANATDLKIEETDANIDANTPYTGMSLTIHSTPQSLGGSGDLVGGPFNFGFTLNANNGTSQQAYEWLQRQLRKTTDIDSDGGTGIGRTIDGLARFIGDSFIAGQDGSGNFPTNPQGGGSGVYIANLSAVSKNSTTMYDNTGALRSYPIGTPVTLDFNQTLIDDTLAKYTLFFDRTIRTAVADLVVNAGTGANGTITSAGAGLPAALDAGVGAYIRVSGFTGGDASMNGVYQVTGSIDSSSYDVTRWDGKTIVTTGAAACSLDQHCIDTPDAIVVKDNLSADVTGLASSDYSFTFAYSTNTQGGRSGGTDAFVLAKAIGQDTAQYTASTVQQIESATAKTIPLVAQQERNFNNP
jgi:hypothetical protein